MTSEGFGEQKCRGFDGGRRGVFILSGFYFRGIHWYRRPANTLLNLNSNIRCVHISKPTSICMTYLCSLSLARAEGGGAKLHFRLEFASLSSFWNGNPLVSAAD